MNQNVKKLKGISLSVATAVIVSGCSIAPKPFKKEEIVEASKAEMSIIKSSEKINNAVTLDEAIERAIKFNRQKRVKVMEAALAQKQLDIANYDMLPSLTANAGYSERDSYAATASSVFVNGEPGPVANTYSVSQAKELSTSDITFSWNILDFGLSYVRAKQEADRFLISKEKERKVLYNISQEVRRSYYQAVTSDELLKRIRPLMKEVREALKDSSTVRALRIESPMDALLYQRELLDILRDLSGLEKTMTSAKVELAELMGLTPDTEFELAEKVQDSYDIPELNYDISTMEKVALENRPELLESRYRERISEKEIDSVILKMLPGITLDAGYNYNDSDYILDNNWQSLGAKVSWNLFNIFKYDSMSDMAKSKQLLAKEQKLALSLAVVTQVHLANIRHKQAIGEYKLANEYLKVSKDIYEQAMNARELQVNSKLVLIKEKLSYLLATLRHSSAYANMQNSYGRIYASMGINKAMAEKIMPVEDKSVEVTQEVPMDVPEQNGAEENVIDEKEKEVVSEPVEKLVEKEIKAEETPKIDEEEVAVNSVDEKTDEAKEYSKEVFDADYSKAHILLEPGEQIMLMGEQYSIKKGDTISDLSAKYNVKINRIVIDNFWLIEQNRVMFK